MIDMKKALQNIDDVIEKGPYKDCLLYTSPSPRDA